MSNQKSSQSKSPKSTKPAAPASPIPEQVRFFDSISIEGYKVHPASNQTQKKNK